MNADEAMKAIQKEITAIRLTGDNCDMDDWVYHHLNRIQFIINDYRNAWAKPSEPDPFN